MGRKSSALFVAFGSLVALTLVAYWVDKERRKSSKSREDGARSKTEQQSLPSDSDASKKEAEADGVLDQLFQDAAAKAAKGLPGATQGDKLILYGLYKQATVGDIPDSMSEPSKLFVVAYAKHRAWKNFHGMPKQKAMINYMQAVQHFSDGDNLTARDENADIVYPDDDEEVAEDAMQGGMGVRVSTMAHEVESNNENNTTVEHALRQAAASCDSENGKVALERVRDSLKKGADVNDTDESGQTALHFAADRGSADCLQLLLEHGADVHAADHEGISVLQAAVIAGNTSAVKLLLEAGADPDQVDMDGDTPRSCAEDDGSEEMKQLFAKEARSQ